MQQRLVRVVNVNSQSAPSLLLAANLTLHRTQRDKRILLPSTSVHASHVTIPKYLITTPLHLVVVTISNRFKQISSTQCWSNAAELVDCCAIRAPEIVKRECQPVTTSELIHRTTYVHIVWHLEVDLVVEVWRWYEGLRIEICHCLRLNASQWIGTRCVEFGPGLSRVGRNLVQRLLLIRHVLGDTRW
jgi:hypothetical protein